jgi:hypothetical protein
MFLLNIIKLHEFPSSIRHIFGMIQIPCTPELKKIDEKPFIPSFVQYA